MPGMRVTQSVLEDLVKRFAAIKPAPEGFEWHLERYAPGGVTYYRLILRRTAMPGYQTDCRPFGMRSWEAREMYAFLCGLLAGVQVEEDVAEATERHMGLLTVPV